LWNSQDRTSSLRRIAMYIRKSFASWGAHFRSFPLISLPQTAAVTNYRLTSLASTRAHLTRWRHNNNKQLHRLVRLYNCTFNEPSQPALHSIGRTRAHSFYWFPFHSLSLSLFLLPYPSVRQSSRDTNGEGRKERCWISRKSLSRGLLASLTLTPGYRLCYDGVPSCVLSGQPAWRRKTISLETRSARMVFLRDLAF